MRRYMSVKRLGALVLAAVLSVSAAFVSEAAASYKAEVPVIFFLFLLQQVIKWVLVSKLIAAKGIPVSVHFHSPVLLSAVKYLSFVQLSLVLLFPLLSILSFCACYCNYIF